LARDLSAVLQEEDATVDQWRVLRTLDVDQGRSMGEIAAALEIPHPTLTRLVDTLVDSSHLYRTQSSEDRRRVSVHLSSRGRKLLDRLDALATVHETSIRIRCGDRAVQDLVLALRDVRDRLN
ncbi:MAG: MarR family transcriptional regulator, partial [Actinomycetes bacterium]